MNILRLLVIGILNTVLSNPVVYQVGLNENNNAASGPIDTGTNTISTNNWNLLTNNGLYATSQQFTVSGFFQILIGVVTRLIFCIPADTTGTRYLLMVFYNSTGIFAAYGGKNEVTITMPLKMEPGLFNGVYIFLTVSVNMQNRTMTMKAVQWSYPQIYVIYASQSNTFSDPNSLYSGFGNKNLLLANTYQGCQYGGYWGKFKYLRFLINFFSTDQSTNTFWETQQIFIWRGRLDKDGNAVNDISQTYNQLTSENMQRDSTIGVLFSESDKKQRVYFPRDKSMLVGEKFTFAVWVKIDFKGQSWNRGRFDVLYFVPQSRDTSQFFTISLIESFGLEKNFPPGMTGSEKAYVQVTMYQNSQQTHFAFPQNQFVRLIVRVYPNYQYGYNWADVYINQYHLNNGNVFYWIFQQSLPFTGGGFKWVGFGNAYQTMKNVVHAQVFDLILANGVFLTINNAREGCMVQFGAINKNCLLCQEVSSSASYSDVGQLQNCAETRSYSLYESGKNTQNDYLCGTGQYYDNSVNDFPCTQYTASNNVYRVSSSKQVISCEVGYTLSGNQCTGSQDAFCTNQNTVLCQKFSDTYKKTSSEVSLSCSPGYYVSSGNCLSSCPDCYTCVFQNSILCTSCVSGTYLDTTTSKCVGPTGCPDTLKFYDTVNNRCQATCPSGTLILSYDTVNQCISRCPETGYNNLVGQQCFSVVCDLGSYAIDKTCYPCVKECASCYGGSYKQCMTCTSGYFLLGSICGTECSSPNKYKNPFNNSCTLGCDSPKYAVQDPVAPYCANTCPSNYSFFRYTCVLKQPYPNTYFIASQNTYYWCPEGCQLCANATFCSACKSGFYLYGSSCVSSCPSTIFTNVVDKTCTTSCPSNLITINYDVLKQCAIVCPQLPSGVQLYLLGVTCVSDCGAGYYKDTTSKICKTCDQACTTCATTATTCFTCQKNFYFLNNACQSTCPQQDGIIYYMDDFNGMCQTQCPSDLVSVPQGPLCLDRCPTNPVYYLYNTTKVCMTSMPQHTYCKDFICYDCDSSCSNCTAPDSESCTICYPNTYLYQSTCQNTCPDGLYWDQFNWICQQACPQTLWVSSTYCLGQCNSTDYRYNNRFCVNSPPAQTYCTGQGGLDCADCAKQCSKCTGPLSNQCQQCNMNYYLTGSVCSPICDTSMYFYDKTNWQCVFICPLGSSVNLYNKTCTGGCTTFNYYNSTDKYKYCFLTCPDKTYPDNSNCFDCDSRCQLCVGKDNDQCQKCVSGYYLSFGTTCDSVCLDTNFIWMNTVTSNCESRCPFGTFKWITSVYKCVAECPTNMLTYFNQSQCVVSCPAYTFLKGTRCFDCSYQCATCYGTFQDQCYTCKNTFFKEGSSCVVSCSVNNPFLDIESLTCLPKCPTDRFAEMNLKQCYKKCPKNPTYFVDLTVLPQCLMKCFDGYFGSYSTYTCEACAPQCALCFEATQLDCIKCKIIPPSTYNYYLNQACQDFCPSDTWRDQVNLVCQTQCPDGTYSEPVTQTCIKACAAVYYGTTCLEQCPQNYFDDDRICSPCYPGCTQCVGYGQSDCAACNQTLFLNSKGQCITKCDKTLPYGDQIERICLSDCSSPKFVEVSNLYCHNQCPSQLYIDGQTCVVMCPSNKYFDEFKNCLPCDSTCSTCYGPTNNKCNSCVSGYFLEITYCSTNCSSIFFYFDMVNNYCQYKCPSNTLKNTDKTGKRWCYKQCTNDYPLLYNAECFAQCPIATYQSGSNCYQCSSGCTSCLDELPISCLSCVKGQYFDGKSCYTTCPLSTWQNEVHMRCEISCPLDTLMLITDRFYCIHTCPKDYLQYNQRCLLECPPKTYQSGNKCLGCAVGCEDCDPTNLNVCTSCLDGYFLEQSTCSTKCSDTSQYQDFVNHKCQDECPSNTIIYQNKGILQCLSRCPMGYNKYKGYCITECPANTFRPSFECLDCSKECALCYGPLYTQCTLCVQGYYQHESTCSVYCPQGYYSNAQNRSCEKVCPDYLLTVKNLMTCVTQCPTSPVVYYQYKQICLNTCPAATFLQEGVCYDCAAECSACYGKSRSQCLKCNSGYYLDQNFCGDFCPQSRPYKNTLSLECVQSCPVGSVTVTQIKECYQKCPSGYIFYRSSCVFECPNSFYNDQGYCKACYPSCSSCTGSLDSQCSSCIDGYYLFDDQCLLRCPINMPWQDEVTNQCMITCPLGKLIVQSTQQCFDVCPSNYPYLDGYQCLTQCPSGKYSDYTFKCSPCSYQCTSCFGPSNTQCSLCTTNYFFINNTCSDTCPPGRYAQTSTRSCVEKCEQGTLIDPRDNKCVLICIPPYFEDPDSGSCVQTCPTTRYPSDKGCLPCSVECDGCFGPSNSDCKKCRDAYPYKGGRCSGDCPPKGYTKISNQCQPCSFKCDECKDGVDICVRCRGDRIKSQGCECKAGYYDDGRNDKCQKCSSQCKECQNYDVCTKCFNNQVGPSCFCLRATPQNNFNWCVACEVAFLEIRFMNNIDYIQIDMGHQININTPNPYQPSEQNCKLIFQTETLPLFGKGPQCWLEMSTQQFITILLGQNATVVVNDTINLKNDSIIDISDPSCTTYIKLFFRNQVLPPLQPQTPTAVFSYPRCPFTLCSDLIISIKHRESSGLRDFVIQSWSLLSVNSQDGVDVTNNMVQLRFLINQQSSQIGTEALKLSSNLLLQFTTYVFKAEFRNFLNHVGSNKIQVTTADKQTPMLIIGLDYLENDYYIRNPLVIPIYIVNQNCQNDLINVTDEGFSAQLNLFNATTNKQLLQELFEIQEGINLLEYSLPAFLLPPEEYIIIQVNIVSQKNPVRISSDSIGKSSQFIQAFKYKQSEYIVKFSTVDRLIGKGNDQFSVAVTASDPDVEDVSQQMLGFQFDWICTNMVNLQNCKYSSGQSIVIEQAPQFQLKVHDMMFEMTYTFFAKVSKGSNFKVGSQMIALTARYDIFEIPFTANYDTPTQSINPSQEVTTIYKPQSIGQKNYFVVMYDWNLLTVQQIKQPSFRVRLVDYKEKFDGSNKVVTYFLPSNYSTPFYINEVPIIEEVTTTPKSGFSLTDLFTIELTVDTSLSCNINNTYTYLYYFTEDSMNFDASNFQIINGYRITDEVEKTTIQTYLPSGITISSTLYILVQATNYEGAISYASDVIQVNGHYTNVKNTLDLVYETVTEKYDDIRNVLFMRHLLMLEMRKMEDYACYKDCSGFGTCQSLNDTKCICIMGKTLADCSGSVKDYQKSLDFIERLTLTINEATKYTDAKEHFYNQMIVDIQQYIFSSKALAYTQNSNLSDIARLITDSQLFLLQQKNKLIDYQNSIGQNYLKNQSVTTDMQDISQIVNQNQLLNYLEVYGQLIKTIHISNKNDSNLGDVMSSLVQTVQILQETLIQTKLPGQALTAVKTESLGMVVYRAALAQVVQYAHQNLSLDVFSQDIQNLDRYQKVGQRQLLQSTDNLYYDLLFIQYGRNPYAYQSNFPYPGQSYVVQDLKVRQFGRQQTSLDVLGNLTYNFELTEAPPKNLICIQLSSLYGQWTNSPCQTVKNDKKNHIYLVQCKCQYQDPTTLINDYNYLFLQRPYIGRLLLPKELIYSYVSVLSTVWFILFVFGIIKDLVQDGQMKNLRKASESTEGQVTQLIRVKKQRGSIILNQQVNDTRSQQKAINHRFITTDVNNSPRRDNRESVLFIRKQETNPLDRKELDQLLNYAKNGTKYSCDNFHYQHGVLQVIFRYKLNNPRWFRITQIYNRYLIMIAALGWFADLNFGVLVDVCVIQSGVVFLHFVEYQQARMVISLKTTAYSSCIRPTRFLITMMTMAAAWFMFTQAFKNVVDGGVVTDWIIGIGYIILIDQVPFEILKFIVKRLTYGESDQELIDKLKILKEKKKQKSTKEKQDEKRKMINQLQKIIEK